MGGYFSSLIGSSSVPAALSSKYSRDAYFKMIFVVNMKLKMGVGKVAAQVGHATLGCYQAAQRTPEGTSALDSWDYKGARKIVVRGDDTEHLIALQRAARSIGLFTCLVQDAGHTQVEPGSRTVLAIFGEISEVDSITKDLKLL
ncbi:hypothetical protein QR680_005411 [Steinernema hermaphroditum]|uniref:peptidyl-tRNA hydrolase n=1 Tax=Steinernema hermaphroditum TaxID=289476 RepID=A0AA39HRY8_9BILA|nr:hypothetical protein QR680_005411 [Steinernema hermaphroditum]